MTGLGVFQATGVVVFILKSFLLSVLISSLSGLLSIPLAVTHVKWKSHFGKDCLSQYIIVGFCWCCCRCIVPVEDGGRRAGRARCEGEYKRMQPMEDLGATLLGPLCQPSRYKGDPFKKSA